jgi:ketosteroid isomerase-like protein
MSEQWGTQTVRRYLDAMEARDLDRAKGILAPDFRMVFPGPAVLHTLEELIAWSKERYRSVAKTYDHFDEIAGPDGRRGSSVVYCFGTLHGVWNDGSAFEGIRFIDRFELRDGKIVDQKVWNDMGEVRLAAQRG